MADLLLMNIFGTMRFDLQVRMADLFLMNIFGTMRFDLMIQGQLN